MRNLKRKASMMLRTSLLAIPAIVFSGAAQSAIGGEVMIGQIVAITGAAATQGYYHMKAGKLAQKHINEAGGIKGKKINLDMQDSQSTNPGALAALNKIVERDKALVLIGPVRSTEILAVSDTVKNLAVPTMIGGTNVTLTRRGNPWLFRCRPDDSIAASAMVKYVKEDMKLKRVGILHDSDAYGNGAADIIEAEVKARGMILTKREKYTTRDRDFMAQLLSLKSAGTEVMCVYGHAEESAVIMRQYRQIGSPFKYIGSPGSANTDCLVLAREAAEGLLAVVDYVPDQSEPSKKYIKAYRKEFNEEMDALASWTYDALYILALAIRNAGEDRAKIKQAILAIRDYQGVAGTYAFTPNGDGLHEVSIIRNEKGANKLIKVMKMAPK
jgi:branched-chain amino acid transport system substrate-binding protein